ncbi:MAG TPA: hypothetical protein VES42_00165, partial [Pilimelia sp.]|nr:hypothetical protein [Pilimelia sp.]
AGFAGALVVQVGSAPTVAEGRVPWGPAAYLGDAVHWLPGPGAGPGAASSVLVGQGGGSVVAGVVRAGSGRAVVLAGRHLHRSATTRALVEALAAQVPLAVVEMGWPGPWRPAGARAFVLTFGAGPANARAALAALGVSGGSPDDRGQFSGS